MGETGLKLTRAVISGIWTSEMRVTILVWGAT